MTGHQHLQFLTICLCLCGVSGCATQPIAQQYRQEAQAENLTFTLVLKNPQAYVGDVVLWGGAILETQNTSTGTDLVVLQIPLSREERPEGARYSKGRFIVRSSRFLDPRIFTKNKRITMAGVVAGEETRPLGAASYSYPVVSARQIYLWKRPPRYAYPYGDGWGPSYWWPYWGPYWDGVGEFNDFGDEDEDRERGERGTEEHEERGSEMHEQQGGEAHEGGIR